MFTWRLGGVAAAACILIATSPGCSKARNGNSGESTSGTGADADRAPAGIDLQKERVGNIRGETLQEAIENLANFDDNQFAMTLSADGFFYGDPEDEMLRVSHLLRVRRLLEEGRRAPETVAPLLRRALREALKSWPEARAARVRMWNENPRGFSQEGPDGYGKASARAMAATYVLAELRDFDSVQLLAKSYKQQLRWLKEYKPYPALPVPVPPAMSLYALHRLVSAYPRGRMSPAALTAADAYSAWARDRVAPVKQRVMTPWDSRHDSTDPMVRMADPKRVILRSTTRPARVSIYPIVFADGKPIQGATDSAPTPEAIIWFEKMSHVIQHLTARQQ
jgi:hypothetical protein